MNTRLIFAIFSSLLEEAALAGIVLWGLPRLGIDMPIAGLVTLMVALAAYDVTAYRMGSRALRKKPVAGLHTMVGTKGKTVRPLAPKGLVSIKGEIWEAESPGANIDVGEEIVVVAQDGLKLTVRRSRNKD